jgi:hypothetical protein
MGKCGVVVLVSEEDILIGHIHSEQGIKEIANIKFRATRDRRVKSKQINADFHEIDPVG